MDMQKIFKPLLLIASTLFCMPANAVSIGSFTFDDNAIADQLVTGTGQAYNGTDWYFGSGNTWQGFDSNTATWQSSAAPTDATDTSGSSFLATTQAITTPLSLGLDFSQTSAFNGEGSDLVFFFLFDQSANNANVTINGISQTLSFSNVFNDSGVQQVANNVIWDGTTLSNVLLMSGEIDLIDFGYAQGEFLYEPITLELSANSDTPIALSMAAALNSSPVPLPAPLLLFLSGLTGLGIISRRRHRA